MPAERGLFHGQSPTITMAEPQPKPTLIIGLTGLAGTGKDTVAQMLTQRWDVAGHSSDVMAFADPIRAMCLSFLRHAGIDDPEDYLTDRQLKEATIPEVGVSYRHLAQTLGTEWGQQCVGRGVWINLLKQRLLVALRRRVTHVVVTDARFALEADWLREQGGVIWRIERAGIDAVREHASESDMVAIKPNRVIRNDGTLDDLRQSIGYELAVLDYEKHGLVARSA